MGERRVCGNRADLSDLQRPDAQKHAAFASRSKQAEAAAAQTEIRILIENSKSQSFASCGIGIFSSKPDYSINFKPITEPNTSIINAIRIRLFDSL